MVKFLVFDMFASWIYAMFPFMAEAQLLVSLLSGAVAGVRALIA
jgi:hypothetical protein